MALDMTQAADQPLPGVLHFIAFKSCEMEGAIELAIEAGISSRTAIVCTGGGAHKFENMFKEKLRMKFHKADEFACLIDGLMYLTMHVPDEIFSVAPCPLQGPEIKPEKLYHKTIDFPCLVVNVGSGVSVLKVERDGQYSRVSGSSIGGGTFMGLANVLTSCTTFDGALSRASSGCSSNVDLLVKDMNSNER